MGLPLLIHQIWFDLGKGPLPVGEYAKANQTWRKHNPDLTFRLWSKPEVEALIQKDFSWFWPTYRALAEPIHKIDAVRPLIMWKFGGMYVDMDIECTRPVRPLLEQTTGVGLWRDPGGPRTLANSFMMGPAQHPFWLHYARLIQDRVRSWLWCRRDSWITTIFQSGPLAMDAAYRSYDKHQPKGWCRVYEYRELFPYREDWTPSAYGMDGAARGWGGTQTLALDVSRIIIILAFLLLLLLAIRWARRR